jgi:hypothetical protein
MIFDVKGETQAQAKGIAKQDAEANIWVDILAMSI